jgi:hypothetical protein
VKISKYWKAVVASAGPVLLAAQAAVDDGHIDAAEAATILIAILVAVGVWRVPNKQR